MRDFDRGLNARGVRGAKLIGEHIRQHGVRWDLLIASPAARVQRTLEAALPALSPHYDKRLYLADADTLLEVLRGAGDADSVLIAGHNPGLQDLLFALVPPSEENDLFDEASIKFPTASFAVLELAIDDWSNLAKETGKLVHFARPRDLDPTLGPELA
ncbi:phosphoglycerate mutase [Tsuneonella deserti]|uniref:Phosphoglycerate mutase n=2 Tax=Tsuneonella deserti TaxID=2035528 RepID=A0ABQ1S150_9SPHN|nr:phosphoglycerate mutase [Tsuneonella deserti]